MNTQSNAIPDTPCRSAGFRARGHPGEPAYVLARCNANCGRAARSIIAPLAVAGLILFGFLISMFRLPGMMRAAVGDSTRCNSTSCWRSHTSSLRSSSWGPLLSSQFFYCLDALHGERRDRSILFWKSLPVSDLITVLSKASIPLVVLPLLTFAITVVTQWIMLLMSSAALLGNGLSVTTLWSQLSLSQMWMMLLYHLVTVHALWYAPIFCWLLLVSAWARRAPILWAALPVIAIALVEKIAFNTSYFARHADEPHGRWRGGHHSAEVASRWIRR